MSSLFLCRDCSGTFGSLDELQRHEKSCGMVMMAAMMKKECADDGLDESTMMEVNIKMEEETLSDTDSSMLSSSNVMPMTPSSEMKGRYECEECHEMFAVKRELATHMRIHSGEQPHMCTQCGKEFGTRQLLKKHWMWHTGQRSHVCPHCNKAFFQKGHLTQHLMIHSGGRPHECQQCHKTFIFKFDLNRHMKIHQERGFSCQQCGRSFLKQVMLDEHHMKCKGKPSSPIRTITPTMRATINHGAESSFKPVITTEQISKMAQKLFAQQQQNQQRAVLSSLLMKQENLMNNNNQPPVQHKLELPIQSIPSLLCVICNTRFPDQSTFAIHTYMHHIANTSNLTIDSSAAMTTPNVPAALSSSDADPATDTSCASSPQKASPFPLESCMEQSSVSPGSSSSQSHSPRPTVSEASTAATQCKECVTSWQRLTDLEQQIAKKGEEFENYRNMVKLIVGSVTQFLSTSTPENAFVNHATTIFKQLQNSL